MIFFLINTGLLICQENHEILSKEKDQIISGFIRGGFYGDLKDNGGKPFISSGFGDIGLIANYNPGNGFRAFGDVRLRYGAEFHETVSYIYIKEAFVEYVGKKMSFSAGKKILKWGRADFTNPISKLNPQNYIIRSFDREDMDMGNLLADINWYPSSKINFQAVVSPIYSPSVLIIDPIPLPDYVTIVQLPPLVADQDLISYGIKADAHLKGFDMSLSWFDGYDPMPGTSLYSFTADFSTPVPLLSAKLKMKPYAIKVAGFDFESSIGRFGIRGEASWSKPDLSFSEYEYVPFPEINWVTGMDASFGDVRVTGEYTGKVVIDYYPSPVDPIIGMEPDYSKLLEHIMTNPVPSQ